MTLAQIWRNTAQGMGADNEIGCFMQVSINFKKCLFYFEISFSKALMIVRLTAKK